MKVISPKQMQYLEECAYRDGASESDFMEEAGSGIALVVHDYVEQYGLDHTIQLVCGKGNNAGDAYVAGVHLLHLEYDVVAYQLIPIDDCSDLCQVNYRRFLEEGGRILLVDQPEDFHLFSKGLIVDGILGTGFTGSIREPYATAIRKMNQSGLPIIAVDIPSGLNGVTGQAQENESSIIASETAFLGLPKSGFFLNEGWDSVGKLRYVDFGLPRIYIEESEADLIMLTKDDVARLRPRIQRSRHKYEAGHVIGLAGSPGMPGAALLAGSAALHGGAGIVRLLHPNGMQAELASSIPELIKVPYDYQQIDPIIALMNRSSAVFIGPGLGKTEEAFGLLRQLLPRLTVPTVIDADALAFLSVEDVQLPAQTILTPHRGEMQKLMKREGPIPPVCMDYLQECLEFASNRRVTLVLKGGPTYIIQANEPIYVCPRGDPGMATAGSGDVLTGLLGSLLAQNLSPLHAALLGCYIHGVAGEYAAKELTPYCMVASDILYHFTEGFIFDEM